jgi:hypothetical protein
MFQPDPLLWQAIERRRMIRLRYHGKERLVEPHDHGVLNGTVQLLGYQLAGSSSRPLPNWILMKVNQLQNLEVLEKTFAGGRPTASGKHLHWDIFSSESTDRLNPFKPITHLHRVPPGLAGRLRAMSRARATM